MCSDRFTLERTTHRPTDLGHDNNLFTRQVQLLDRIAQDDLGETVRVDLSRASRAQDSALDAVIRES